MNPARAVICRFMLAFALCAPLVAQEEARRAFEIADYYGTAFVSGPALSPDGQWVVLSVRRYDLAADKSWSELWRVRLDGSELRQLTFGQHNDGAPQFTPDGTRIVFESDRGAGGQLWSLPMDGGEATQLTDFPMGLSGAVFSRDGRWIAATSEVWPECGADAAAGERKDAAAAKGKLSVHVADELLYRHWTAWNDGKVNHVLLIDAKTGKVRADLTPGPREAPAFSLGSRGYDFTPDGREFVFTANRDAVPAKSTNVDLWAVGIGDDGTIGAARCLTDANEAWDGAPLASPDGARLAYVSQAVAAYESDLMRLTVLDRADGAVRVLTDRSQPAGWSGDWVDDMRWSSDGKALYFQAQVQGRTPIYRCDLASGQVRQVLLHGTLGGFELTPDGSTLVYARRTVGEPPELFACAVDGGEPRRLTHFNEVLERDVDIRPAEEMWVQGDGDYKVHVFLVKPHGFREGVRYPLILNVHGGPQSQWADAYRGDWQVYPGKGYVVAFCNPTGSTGYGQDFVDGISKDWGGRVFRDLMKVTDALEGLPYVDKDRMGAMGWSYGGYMMMWFQGHTQRFKCQAAMMGLYDLRSFYGATEELWFPAHDLAGQPWNSELYDTWSPSNAVERFQTPALVVTGELDYRVPYTQSLQYFTALQEKGVPSRLVVLPKAGHWPGWREMIFYYNAHLDWFHRWLGGEPAPYDVLEHARQRGIPAKATAEGQG